MWEGLEKEKERGRCYGPILIKKINAIQSWIPGPFLFSAPKFPASLLFENLVHLRVSLRDCTKLSSVLVLHISLVVSVGILYFTLYNNFFLQR